MQRDGMVLQSNKLDLFGDDCWSLQGMNYIEHIAAAGIASAQPSSSYQGSGTEEEKLGRKNVFKPVTGKTTDPILYVTTTGRRHSP
jgi:hypothetical protein